MQWLRLSSVISWHLRDRTLTFFSVPCILLDLEIDKRSDPHRNDTLALPNEHHVKLSSTRCRSPTNSSKQYKLISLHRIRFRFISFTFCLHKVRFRFISPTFCLIAPQYFQFIMQPSNDKHLSRTRESTQSSCKLAWRPQSSQVMQYVWIETLKNMIVPRRTQD